MRGFVAKILLFVIAINASSFAGHGFESGSVSLNSTQIQSQATEGSTFSKADSEKHEVAFSDQHECPVTTHSCHVGHCSFVLSNGFWLHTPSHEGNLRAGISLDPSSADSLTQERPPKHIS